MKEIIIQQVSNGFILINTWDVGEDTDSETIVIENQDNEQKMVEKILYEVAEKLGVVHSKFQADNLNISWDGKGEKHEEKAAT